MGATQWFVLKKQSVFLNNQLGSLVVPINTSFYKKTLKFSEL